MYYLDTSILAAYYCPEPLSEKVEKIVISTKRPLHPPFHAKSGKRICPRKMAIKYSISFRPTLKNPFSG
jgi:hypothetical protein